MNDTDFSSKIRLTDPQRWTALTLLQRFKDCGMQVTNRGVTSPYRAFDEKRRTSIPEIKALLDDFMADFIDLTNFKESHELLCRKHDYWGFKGFAGQMLLNQLTNWSSPSKEMAEILRKAFQLPGKPGAVLNSVASRGGSERNGEFRLADTI